MEHLALYRSWRPQFFREVIGQEHVCRTLQNAVRLGRVAHAYLFCGPRGTGKTSTARILAKAVNCPHSEDGEPCNNCSSCQSTTAGISMDVIEMDAASHRGIEEIRDLNQKVCFAPTAGQSRLFIIDEVHMLTGEAFNALLKTLEEPPRHTIFVLATTEAHKVPLTIMSRCQRFDFRRLGRETIKEHLRRVAASESWQIDDESLDLLSRHAGGALRDALGLLEQAASFTGGAITRADLEALTGAMDPDGLRALLAAAMAGDVPSLLQLLDRLFARGCEPRQVLFQLIDQVRDRLFAAATPGPERTGYVHLLRGLAAAEADLKGNSRPDLVLELALVRFADALAVSAPGRAQRTPAGAASTAAGDRATVTGAPAPAAPSATAAVAPAKPANDAPAADSSTPGEAAAAAAIEETAATAARQPSPPVPSPVAGNLGEIRKILGRGIQKQPLVRQALSLSKLEQDGNRVILKASTDFFQEMLLKDEYRHKLQDALRQYHPALELVITCEAGASKQERPAYRADIPSGDGQIRESTGAPEQAPESVQPLPEEIRVADTVDDEEPDLPDMLVGQITPDTETPEEVAPAPDDGQGGPELQRPAQSPGVQRHKERQSDPGQQIDPVGVALTLFNGKIINETEVD